MIREQYLAIIHDQLSKLTTPELYALEAQLREGNELDAADVASKILIHRHNSLIEKPDEYSEKPSIGFDDSNCE